MPTGKILTAIAVLSLVTALLHEARESQKSRDALVAAQKKQAEPLAKVSRLETSLSTANARLKASEEDGAKLLGVIDHATTNATSGVVRAPITHDYVEARYKHAQELAKTGNHEEALKEFLWCYDEGMPLIASYGGVRYSFLLQMIAKLGETYPPALAAMRERRDQAEQRTEIVKTTAGYVEVLAGVGDLLHARELAASILAYDGSPEAKAILQEHAARARPPRTSANRSHAIASSYFPFATARPPALPHRHMYDFPLTGAQKTFLRSLGQTMEPALKVGKGGLTDEFFKELQNHLNTRELVKLRFLGADRQTRSELIAHIADQGRCVLAGAVGMTALFYRQNPDKARRVIELS